MFTSFSEFKFFQSFRIPVEEADDLRFLVEKVNDMGKGEYIEDAKLLDISVNGLGFSTIERVSVGSELTISLHFKKFHLDLSGTVVRSFTSAVDEEEIIYGVELDEDKRINKFLEQYISSFSTDRLKQSLIDSALKESYTNPSEGFEMFSLLLSLFKDITHFSDKEGFVDNMLEEVTRIMNAQRASIFLINPETNELEAINALGVDKKQLKFDYRLGIAGCVFTTGVALNIDTVNDQTRFNETFDKQFHFQTKSIICHPIHNREDKIIGVIEVINKRNQDRFTVEDERTMKVLSLIFSSFFHEFDPISEKSQIRRFSAPFDREFALIGRSAHLNSLRNSIIKMKDIDSPLLIYGEKGVGKSLYARILHHEGNRGLKKMQTINCEQQDKEHLERELFGPDEEVCKFTNSQGGTIILHEVGKLSLEQQRQLYQNLVNRGLPNGKTTFDNRVISTTSKDLGKAVDDGEFERELYQLISKAYVFIEPLRRRIGDLEELIDYFLKIECKQQGLLLKSFSPRLVEKLKDYDWPRNISELKVCVERSVLYHPKAHIITDIVLDNETAPLLDLEAKKRTFGSIPHVSDYHVPLKERLVLVEKEMIEEEIKRLSGNKSQAAKSLGISREALRKKLMQGDEMRAKLDGDEEKSDKKKAA